MIELEHITYTYGNLEALHDVSFAIKEKSCCAIAGPSGSGKTTLLHVIAGLLKPQAGQVHIADAKTIAMIFQGAALFPHTRVKDNIAYGLLLNRYPSTLSGGEKQRVDIARAIVRKPDILLMDEPFASLDPSLRNVLMEEIMRIKEEYGMTLIMVTHDQSDAMRMADMVYVMHQGKVVENGTPGKLFDDPDVLFTASFFGTLIPNQYTVTVKGGTFSLLSMEYHTRAKDGDYSVIMRPSSFKMLGTIPILIDGVSRYEDRWLIKGRTEGEEVSVLLDKMPVGSALFAGLQEDKVLLFDQSGKRVREKIFA